MAGDDTFWYDIPRSLLGPIESSLAREEANLRLHNSAGDVFVSCLTPREGLAKSDHPIDCQTCAKHPGKKVCTTHPPGHWLSAKFFTTLWMDLCDVSMPYSEMKENFDLKASSYVIAFEVICIRAETVAKVAELFANDYCYPDDDQLFRRKPSDDVLAWAACNGVRGGPLVHGETLQRTFLWFYNVRREQIEQEGEEDDKGEENDDSDDDSDDGSDDGSDDESGDEEDDDSDSDDESENEEDDEGMWSDSEWEDEDE